MIESGKKRKIWLSIFIGLFYLFVFFVLLHNSFSYLDPDFGWHMKIGEQIWQAGAVPNLNYENFTLEGRTWVDFEWLMNLITYGFYHNFGYIGTSVFFALLIIAVAVIQLQFVRRNFLTEDRGLIFFLALQAFGLYASLPHLGIRMQEITVLCLLLLLIIIFYYNKDKKYKTLFWLLPLFLFWASAHAGFLIGFFIFGLFVFVKVLEIVAQKLSWNFIDYKNVLTLRQVGIFIFFSFAAFAVTLATPYGVGLYEFLLGYRDSFYQTHIGEWQGQYFFPFVYSQMIFLEIPLLFLALSFLAIFIFKREPREKLNVWDIAVVAIFTFLAMKARRHFPLLIMVSLPVLTAFFVNFFNLRFSFLLKTKVNHKLAKIFSIFIFAALALSSILIAVNINFTKQPESFYRNVYPLEAIKFLRSHPEWNERRIFNEYGWGGYMIWQYPERKLFIDGRLPQFELNGNVTMLREYYSFFDKEKTAAKLDEYGIGLVLIKAEVPLPEIHWWEERFFGISREKLFKAQEGTSDFLKYFLTSADWQKVYDDGLAYIFLKK